MSLREKINEQYRSALKNKNKKIIVKNVGDEVSIKEAMKNIDNKKI